MPGPNNGSGVLRFRPGCMAGGRSIKYRDHRDRVFVYTNALFPCVYFILNILNGVVIIFVS
ncbi:hypothetical protein DXA95_12110 [Odoribacter sp. OF09-27XD]|nr:hypothetical protein DXA95_12110 [Odoribacter sp. OF09-27XD]